MNKLSAEEYQGILAALKSDARRSNEKRTEPRVGLRKPMEICFLGGAGRPNIVKSAWLRDISASGLGLVTGFDVALGRELLIGLPRRDKRLLHVQYKVSYVRELSRGMFSVGARLIRTLEDAAEHPKALSA